MRDTISVSWKMVAIIGIIAFLLFGTFVAFFGMQSKSSQRSINFGSSQEGIPEKCKLPAGEDINSWKEHLGHHAETQDCLQYFD